MKVLFLTSEVAPWAKTGGLADVAAALPRALNVRGHDCRTFLPLYPRIREKAGALEEVLAERPVRLGAHTFRFALHRHPSQPIYFVDCPALYAREGIYTADPDEHLRFLLLGRAALDSALRLDFFPDVVHCNDWPTALVPLYLKTSYAGRPELEKTRSLLTIHNLNYQGAFRSEVLADTGLERHAQLFHQDQLRQGRINFLLHGVLYADGLSTVSPTYAREIQGPDLGAGLDLYLRARSTRLVGILNGVDYDEWNPATDPHLPYTYAPEDLRPKEKIKQILLSQLGLSHHPRIPTLGIVSRLAYQKGFELVFEALPKFLGALDLRLVVLGSGENRYEELFARMERSFPGKVCFWRGYNPDLAHLIEAGSDFFLMPSRYEPCGLNQMYSLKYGTVPIVHKTGGLADTVEMWNPHTGEGTGFLFENFDANGLAWALTFALDTFRDPIAFSRLQRNGMAKNFSWDMQARLYSELYTRLLSL